MYTTSHHIGAPMPQEKKRSMRTSVVISEAQHAQLEKLAGQNDVSVAWIIRQAIQQFLDRNARDQKTLGIRTLSGPASKSR